MTHKLMVWGNDEFGQISGAPGATVKVDAIAPGGSVNGLVLKLNGTPILWGDGSMIPPPGGPVGPPAISGALATEKFHAVAIGRDNAVFIRPNGSLAAWPVTSVPAGSYSAVAVAFEHAVAIVKNDGTLKTWGLSATSPLNPPEGGPFKEVAARLRYSLALHNDGTLFGWGYPGQGADVFTQNPAGSPPWAQTPQGERNFYVPNQTFDAIASGNVHALAIQPDGTVIGWGDGTGGALEPPAGVRFTQIAAGWGFSIGLDRGNPGAGGKPPGTLWGWGEPAMKPPTTQAWKFASQGWADSGDGKHFYFPGKRFKSIAAAAFHIMAITLGPD